MNITEMHDTFSKIELGDLTANKKRQISNDLQQIKANELITYDDHRYFLEVLKKFREANMEDAKLNGKGFFEFLHNFLGVGEDGIYANGLRFIYELIQNVDDCEYEDISNCTLDVRFDFSTEGKITFMYNEVGFSPANVYALTGIADKTKNILDEKLEIGEKGIGFKSVFGIAESVLVESGKFSFELFKDNFTLPVPRYDNYSEISGTRLTLKMSAKKVGEIYRKIIHEYSKKEVLLKNNLILFLNKLTSLRLYNDANNRYLHFETTRSETKELGDISVEGDVRISISIKDRYQCVDKDIKHEIHCYRYKMPLTYEKESCVSRYGKNTKISRRRHNLVAVIPHYTEFQNQHIQGTLYSFLPTQIKFNAPILIHAPYKLNASREYVDPQGENQWFEFTNRELTSFLRRVYVDLAKRVKENIVAYLPNFNKYFFKIEEGNDKLDCFKRDYLKGALLKEEKIFYTANDNFESAANVIAFNSREKVIEQKSIWDMMGIKKTLFTPAENIDVKKFGIEIIDDVYFKLLEKAFKKPSITEKALLILSKVEGLALNEELNKLSEIELKREQVIVLSRFKGLLKGLRDFCVEKIRKNCSLQISINDDLKVIDSENSIIINDLIEDLPSQSNLARYIKLINNKYCIIDRVDDDFFLPLSNMLLLSKKNALRGFSEFSKKIDKNSIFSANLTIREATERLNKAPNNMNAIEFLNLLTDVRKSMIAAFGEKAYDSYIQKIKEMGTDKNRFINEILQNIDDCRYPANEKPTLKITNKGNEFKVNYNEVGFNNANVRAITSISESTKKGLVKGEIQIGEKGVGFKTVFGVAKSVTIISNAFWFTLESKKPTVPVLRDKKENIQTNLKKGTLMMVELKEDLPKELFLKDNILKLVLCLRKIKRLSVNNTEVYISDCESERLIAIDGKEYRYEKFVYKFKIDDSVAIEERRSLKKEINVEQKICFYIPKQNSNKTYLYSGLPTKIETNIPIVVDAPFKLTTSREDVLQSNWNNIIKINLYEGFIKFIHSIKKEERMGIFKYIKKDGERYFNSDYLNEEDFIKRLSKESIIPIWKSDKFVVPNTCKCKIYPRICFYLFENGVAIPKSEYIVDKEKASQYIQVLEQLGCKSASLSEVIDIISSCIEKYIMNESFRKQLYAYLKENNLQIKMQGLESKIKTMKIIPVKPLPGSMVMKFISSKDNEIFIDTESYSTDKYWLLAETFLSNEQYSSIFGERLKKMDIHQKQGLYRKKIEKLLNSNDLRKVAEGLLNEFQNNRRMFDACKNELKGRINDVPVKFLTGKYNSGKKYVDIKKAAFEGKILPEITVHPEYVEFAKYLECGSIYRIKYDDIKKYDKLTESDVKDFSENEFDDFGNIIYGFMKDNKIDKVLCEKYQLVDYSTSEGGLYIEDNEPFPNKKIIDLSRLKNKIQNADPDRMENYYKMRRCLQWPNNKNEYAKNMYRRRVDENGYTCQICKKATKGKYIEINSIEFQPEFAWEQMQLCLCMKCSKDFVLLRNKEKDRKRFIINIMEADIFADEPIKVQIGNLHVHFTETHLAEVQAILDFQKRYKEKKPVRSEAQQLAYF